jgi:hypothetical protein
MKSTSLLTAAIVATAGMTFATTTNTYYLAEKSNDFAIGGGETAIIKDNRYGNQPSTWSHAILPSNGSTLILDGVKISCSSQPAIVCDGSVTIVLAAYSQNDVVSTDDESPAIEADDGATLTIGGDGELYARGGRIAAAIGGGYNATVGDIIIRGGTITAECRPSSSRAADGAGIGSGRGGSCGNISILGGTITCGSYTEGSRNSSGAAIGSGYEASCGDIYIGPNVFSMTLTRGNGALFIGAGSDGTCGTVTVDGPYRCAFVDSYTQTMIPQPIDSRAEDGTARVFVINWDVDGSPAYTHMPAGTMPVYPHGTPTREASSGVKYTFTGWSPELSVVQGPATYTAVFAKASNVCDGYGTAADPYVVTSAEDLAAVLSFGYPEAMYVTLESGLAATGTFSVASSVTSLNIDLNGGEIVADGANSPAITLQSPAPVAISGPGSIKGTGTAEAVQAPQLVTYGQNVIVREADPVVAAAVFPNGGDSIISSFAQKGNGKWGVTAFAELQSGTAEGMDDGQVLIYAADTVGGLTNAVPLASGYEIKSKANAVKVDVEVESDAAAQFFRIGFQSE